MEAFSHGIRKAKVSMLQGGTVDLEDLGNVVICDAPEVGADQSGQGNPDVLAIGNLIVPDYVNMVELLVAFIGFNPRLKLE